MRLRYSYLVLPVAVFYSGLAQAQTLTSNSGFSQLESISASGAGAAGLPAGSMGTGLKVGDDSILHAGLGVSVGYDSNVLFETSSAQRTAPVLLVSPYLELTNAERDGTRPGGVYYDLTAGATWREYLKEGLEKHRAINPHAGAAVEFSSGQRFSLSLSDQFNRIEIPPMGGDGEPILLDLNAASLALKYAPGGGRLRSLLRYSNLLSYYEGNASTGSNMAHEVVLDVGWNWLPRTAIYLQLSQGLISYLESNSQRSSSFPFKAMAGLRGLLTEKLALNLGAGYANAFYESGANPSGFGNVAILAELRYILTLLSQVAVGYRHDFADSPFVGQYYDMDAVYAMYRQLVASRLVTYLYGRYENRRFGGLPGGISRTDNVLSGTASISYYIQSFLYAGLSYTMMSNQSSLDSATNASGGVDYLKHTILLNLGVVY